MRSQQRRGPQGPFCDPEHLAALPLRICCRFGCLLSGVPAPDSVTTFMPLTPDQWAGARSWFLGVAGFLLCLCETQVSQGVCRCLPRPRCLHACGRVQVRDEIDVMVSHDWPTVVPRYGNTGSLLRCKPFFTDEVNTDTLGSPANWQLLQVRAP